MKPKITETYLKQLKAPQKQVLIKDSITPNLYIKHSPTGRLVFVHRSKKGGAWRVHTLGTFPASSLSDARQKALALNQSSEPLSAMTFSALLSEFAERRPNVPGIYIRFGQQTLGSKKVASITTSMLVKALAEYSTVSPVSANRCLTQWKICFDWACMRGILDVNPLARVTRSALGKPEVPRSRVLSEGEIRALFAIDDPRAKLARFCLSTGLRINEATSGYVDGDIFRVDHTKSKRSHWVYLSDVARQNLGPFPTAFQTQLWLRKQGWGWTYHDARRTASSMMHRLGVEPIVVEKMLGHSLQGLLKVYNVYAYDTERVDASKKLSHELERIISTKA
ncbi:integrase family protein [Cupriavidus sp. amp6]|uniref:tyrosine-type recombinase/integrase n=1 Tax=Cupriavidus sp. amp6 TaxID=388051 RepID=UPI00048C1B19|nr:integrase family protein [Cupriavidus sp. amp6]